MSNPHIRFYACELKPFFWECKPTEEKDWSMSSNAVATSLLSVDARMPKFLDPLIVSYKIRNRPVLVKTSLVDDQKTKTETAQ